LQKVPENSLVFLKKADLSLRGATQSSRYIVPPPGGPFSVSGGNANSTAGGFKYFYFTSNGSLSVTNDGIAGPLPVSFMLIGGGGSASSTGGGGGGAGAFIQKIDYDLGSVSPGSLGSWPVTIGAGGQTQGANPGASSVFVITASPETFTAVGGGGVPANGASGGGSPRSGGTAGSSTISQTISGGNTPPAGIGHDAGTGSGPQNPAGGGTGGGGGGAGAVGQVGSGTKAGDGGIGLPAFDGDANVSSSYGTAGPSPGRWFAGGGAGGAHYSVPGGTGGVGGGGPGAPPSQPEQGQRGTANTGSGGGGGGGAPNAYPGPIQENPSGGPGIMIFRMPTALIT
jgi:hypothetical protein